MARRTNADGTRTVRYPRKHVSSGRVCRNPHEYSWCQLYEQETGYAPTLSTGNRDFYDFAESNINWYELHVLQVKHRLERELHLPDGDISPPEYRVVMQHAPVQFIAPPGTKGRKKP